MPGSSLAFFGSPLFSLSAKLRLLREPFIAPRRDSSDESVASFVRRRLGQEFLDYGIDQMVTGIYAGDPAALSLQHPCPRIQALEARYGSLIRGQIFGARERRRRGEISKAKAPKFSFDDGLQVLPDSLHQQLGETVRLGARVTSISRLQDHWRIRFETAEEIQEDQHTLVLFCGTAHSLARLEIHAPGAPSLEALARIPYPPVTSVVLGFHRNQVVHPCSGFGVLIPDREGFGILGTIFSSSLFAGRAPADHLTLTTYVGGARRAEAASLPDDRLLESVLADLDRLLGVKSAPIFRHIARWPRAIPQYNVGYAEFKGLLDTLEASVPGLYVAGHFRDGVALSDSILTGMRAAERISAALEVSSPSHASSTVPAVS
jgi:oxygen-dependent protoporphyrinogen oxidase